MSGPRYSPVEARAAVAASSSWSETLRRLGMCPTGGATAILRKYLTSWEISTEHFQVFGSSGLMHPAKPLDSYLVAGSTYNRAHLKRRLLDEGRLTPECACCCSRQCGVRHNAPELRRATRPPREQLMREIQETSYSAVGRRYGVSDNAIRKWVLAYRREAATGDDDALASAA